MIDPRLLETGLKLLAGNPSLIDGMMPNIPFPTMGGEFFWNNLAEENGWRVQQNTFTGHCRILDADDIRRAWGSEQAIMKGFKKIVKR